MAASYPSSSKTFPTIVNGQASDAVQVNSVYDEVTAVEQGLLTGLQHTLKPLTTALYDLGTAVLKWRTLFLAGDLSVGGNAGVSGTLAVTGGITLTGGLSSAVVLNGVDGVSLASLVTGNNNNVTLPGTTSIAYLNGAGAPVLTGMTAGVMGRLVYLLNVGSVDIALGHETTSTAANRFSCPNAANLTVRAHGGVAVIYQTTSSRWCVVAP